MDLGMALGVLLGYGILATTTKTRVIKDPHNLPALNHDLPELSAQSDPRIVIKGPLRYMHILPEVRPEQTKRMVHIPDLGKMGPGIENISNKELRYAIF